MAQVSHRERLIEGALECLKTKGYAKTTARDIAAAADANLASITYHFGSKEALLNEALLRVSEGWTEALGAQALDNDGDPLTRVAVTYDTVTQTFAGSPAYRMLFASFLEAIAQSTNSAELRAQLAHHYEAMRKIVANLIRAGLGSDAPQGVDPDALASFFLAVYDGFLIQGLLDPQRLPDARQLIDSLANAVTTSSSNSLSPG
jgi:AcrR family transcriptional regulator